MYLFALNPPCTKKSSRRPPQTLVLESPNPSSSSLPSSASQSFVGAHYSCRPSIPNFCGVHSPVSPLGFRKIDRVRRLPISVSFSSGSASARFVAVVLVAAPPTTPLLGGLGPVLSCPDSAPPVLLASIAIAALLALLPPSHLLFWTAPVCRGGVNARPSVQRIPEPSFSAPNPVLVDTRPRFLDAC